MWRRRNSRPRKDDFDPEQHLESDDFYAETNTRIDGNIEMMVLAGQGRLQFYVDLTQPAAERLAVMLMASVALAKRQQRDMPRA